MSLLSRLAVQAARAYGILSSKAGVSVSYLVIAGGGSGGGSWSAGGGGAGGMLASTTSLSTLNTYSITVGAGGASTSGANGIQGNNSVISGTGLTTVTSTGGGYGAVIGGNGGNGGSGGGAGSNATTSGGTGIAGQGNNGGSNIYAASPYPSAGGGGAGAVGANSTSTTSGAGGAGSASSISGSSVTYAGGGGGGANQVYGGTAGAGGSGGGGAGGAAGANGTAGTANTGGGGGGCGATSGIGGQGGSGIVIISYTSATPKFVGGTITTSGGNQIHTFTSSGTLSPITPITASYLVVAGGGGGGRQYGGQGSAGGGGAGGLLTSSTTLYSGATYVVTVGAGGAGGSSAGAAPNGSNSVLSGTGLTTITSVGGGGGAGSSGSGASGGSGGGGQGETAPKTGGAGTSGQGNAGGTGAAAGGGGGGASAVGANATTNVSGGNGGAGTASSISGTSVTYAGGGGGGGYTSTAGTGGAGGGASGQTGNNTTPAGSGTANLGGGGGGAAYNASGNYNGGAGGSGVVIISYAGSQVFNGGLVTSSGGNTIHTFNATGALTPLTNNLTNSLRFRRSNNAYLSRTPTVAGNQKTWTYSAWVKRGLLGSIQDIWHANGSGTSENDYFAFDSDTLQFRIKNSNSVVCELITTQVFRDPSAWYHIVAVWDSTQATAANRVKLYVNGNQITAFSTATYPSQNTNTNSYNSTVLHTIGTQWYNSTLSNYLDGYMTDINFIDGQALEPYYFGNNDANGVWKPILYKGTYGTNGFYLTFGNTTSTTTLGYDSSPNGNNWTCNNISLTAGATYDAMLDVPTNTSATVANYPTLNPLSNTSTLTEANLSASNILQAGTTMATPTTGKWYFEYTQTTSIPSGSLWVGVASNTSAIADNQLQGYAYASDGRKVAYNSYTSGYGATWTNGDVIGCALDLDNQTITFYKNNTSQGTAFTSITAQPYVFALSAGGAASTKGGSINCGQRPFSYTPPTGFVALNTFNLPTPTILQGNKYMDATTYTGNGSGLTVVNAGQFKSDLVWIKNRSDTYEHVLDDSVRGAGKGLFSNTTGAENASMGGFLSFNSNGWSMNGTIPDINRSGDNFVGWQWQAGQSSGSSNTSGTITSTVSVSTTAGFSIATFTGTGANATVGHGLGVAPAMYIVKNRSAGSTNWVVYHKSLGATKWIELSQTTAAQTSSSLWNDTAPTSTVFSVGNAPAANGSTNNMVAYCWAEIAGFSKFGSFTANNSSDGNFIYLGFRPRWIMCKQTSGAGGAWFILDTARNTFNVMNNILDANSSGAERNDNIWDATANGMKLRIALSGDFIYAAFAENPFKNSNAR
jgi:hypothetical protein